ncbi:unnamed protein product [Camellia sinensis]
MTHCDPCEIYSFRQKILDTAEHWIISFFYYPQSQTLGRRSDSAYQIGSELFSGDRTPIISLFVGFASAILMFRTRNAIVATGLVAFAAVGLAFPFYMASRSSRMKPVIDSSKPLPPQATFRGPYINTGSRDVGPDYRTYPKK